MGNVNDDKCLGRMNDLERKLDRSLGREIGQVRETAEDAKDCATKKVEKTTFRWTIGILVSILGIVLIGLFGLAIYNTRANGKTDTKVAGIEEKLTATKDTTERLDRDWRDFRTEQRSINEATQRKLDEIKDLVQNR